MNRVLAIMFGATLLVNGAQIPRPSPEFQINLPGGKQLLLSSYKGRPLVVEFLLTTCPHCKASSAMLEKLYQEYKGRGLEVLGVAVNQGALELVPNFVRDLQLTYRVGAADNAKATFYLEQSPIVTFYLPQLVFIDRKGIIRAQYAGDDKVFFAEADREKNIRAEVEKLLGLRPVVSKTKPPAQKTK